MPFNHFVKLEKDLRQGKDIHYCKAICETMELKYSTEANLPVISEEVKQSALNKANRIGLNLEKICISLPGITI